MYAHSVNAIGPTRAGTEADRLSSPFGARPLTSTGQPADPPADPPLAPGRPSAEAIAVLSGGGGDQAATPTQSYARITVDPDTHLVSIAIVNAATDEVIRQVPPEEVIEIARMVRAHLDRRAASAATPGLATIDRRV
jgi:hypothetical protein